MAKFEWSNDKLDDDYSNSDDENDEEIVMDEDDELEDSHDELDY